MSHDVRSSDVIKGVQDVLARPALLRLPSNPSERSMPMDAMMLSFDETQRVRQVRQRSSGHVPTLTTVREHAASPGARNLTTERPSAIEPPSRWHRVWHNMPCFSSPTPAPAKPANTGGGWIYCNPPVSVSSLDGLRSGYQVRTTQGMDMIYGVALPTANDATELVTAYRDLSALADAQP